MGLFSTVDRQVLVWLTSAAGRTKDNISSQIQRAKLSAASPFPMRRCSHHEIFPQLWAELTSFGVLRFLCLSHSLTHMYHSCLHIHANFTLLNKSYILLQAHLIDSSTTAGTLFSVVQLHRAPWAPTGTAKSSLQHKSSVWALTVPHLMVETSASLSPGWTEEKWQKDDRN